jgi:3',5'-cyclic AMP phosphodiesterase CpdA
MFLGGTAAAGAAWSLGWPRAAAWAAQGPADPFRIAYFTDIHARVEWDTPLALEQCAHRINEQKPDLILCGGDLITDGFTSTADQVAPRWAAFQSALSERLAAPLHAAIGNHDLVGVEPADGSPSAADPRADFLRATGLARTYRSMNAGGCHLVFLDPFEVTGDALRYRGVIDPAQLAWLREDVQRVDAATPLILIVHMPLLTGFFQATQGATAAAPSNRVVVNNQEVLAACAGHNLVLVLQGHLHVNEMLRWRKTTFITGGAVCGKWWRGPWHGTPAGFGLVTLRGDRVEWEYHDLGWQARRPTDA